MPKQAIPEQGDPESRHNDFFCRRCGVMVNGTCRAIFDPESAVAHMIRKRGEAWMERGMHPIRVAVVDD